MPRSALSHRLRSGTCVIEPREGCVRSARSGHTFEYKHVSGCAIRADVHRRPNAARQPIIVWLHGGALIFGSRADIARWQLRRYLDAGFTVVCVDYRLAPETKLEAIIEDLRDALEWVRREGPALFQADPQRLAVVGHSAGGYLALMAGLVARPRPRALVSFYGYGDIVGPWYSQPDPYYRSRGLIQEVEARQGVGHGVISEARSEARWRFYVYCRQRGLWPREVSGHDPHEEPEWFAPYCPVRQITPDYPPTLLVHGSKDTDVPYAQSVRAAEALVHAGVRHALVTLPHRGHAFDLVGGAMRDEMTTAAFDRVLAFLRQELTSGP